MWAILCVLRQFESVGDIFSLYLIVKSSRKITALMERFITHHVTQGRLFGLINVLLQWLYLICTKVMFVFRDFLNQVGLGRMITHISINCIYLSITKWLSWISKFDIETRGSFICPWLRHFILQNSGAFIVWFGTTIFYFWLSYHIWFCFLSKNKK